MLRFAFSRQPPLRSCIIQQGYRCLSTSSNQFIRDSPRVNCQQEKQETNQHFIDTTRFNELQDIPKPALLLGFSGAIPFVSLAFASSVTCDQYANLIGLAQVGYGACILTFLGGVHWGKELMVNSNNPDFKTLTWSVLPSLYAWSAFFLPYHLALYYLATGLTGVAMYDVSDQSLPKWYRKLRIPLTLLAATSIGMTGYNLHP
eukprot:TCONS_00060895-protein